MTNIQEMALLELVCFVGSKLAEHGIEAVLSGGACVALYSEGRYVSKDLDFVNTRFSKRAVIKTALAELGFKEEGRHFVHPDTHFLVEFPPGPLGVGDEKVREVVSIRASTGNAFIISATDCLKDRLAGYYHWDDRECLEQAILVAHANEVDLSHIAEWSKREGKAAEFNRIRARLEKVS